MIGAVLISIAVGYAVLAAFLLAGGGIWVALGIGWLAGVISLLAVAAAAALGRRNSSRGADPANGCSEASKPLSAKPETSPAARLSG